MEEASIEVPSGVSPLAWRAVSEVLLQMQLDLERAWTLEEAARIAGYDPHHLAHVFSAVVGDPPLRYLRRLRLERAAQDLLERDLPMVDIAHGAGYRSTEAFARAFRKATGVSPRAFVAGRPAAPGNEPHPQEVDDLPPAPQGLVPRPRIHTFGPLHAVTIRVPSFTLPDIVPAMGLLLQRHPVDGPFQLGGLAQPWGWIGGPADRDLRMIRFTGPDVAPPDPPLMRWRAPPRWYASFDYVGPVSEVATACEWIVGQWVVRSGLRVGFAPVISQLGELRSLDGPIEARLHAPVRALDER
ncbi:MAG: helix-turn-helix transcriptional regulator [Myxococcales bacterium]|nr:helix-turn-helix transcriptional regulator [Myxococcales bacterium]